MNAHKFVAVHGIEKAKAVLGGAPFEATVVEVHGNDFLYMQYTHAWYWQDVSGEWVQDHSRSKQVRLSIADIKQVVESVDTIDRLFGPDQAKLTMRIAKEIGYTSDYEQIKQAIADYELVESYKENQHV